MRGPRGQSSSRSLRYREWIPATNAYAKPDGRRRSWLAEKFSGKLVEKDTERKS
jgi:hypothetical protein